MPLYLTPRLSTQPQTSKKVTKGLVVSMIRDLEDAVNAYADEEYDQVEIDKVRKRSHPGCLHMD